MVGEGSLKGIGLFALKVIHLVSSGKKETLKTMEEHFEKKILWNTYFQNIKKSFLLFLTTVFMIMNKSICIFITMLDTSREMSEESMVS